MDSNTGTLPRMDRAAAEQHLRAAATPPGRLERRREGVYERVPGTAPEYGSGQDLLEQSHTIRERDTTFSPAQLVAGAIGGGLVVAAAVMMLRAVAGGQVTLTSPQVTVGWLTGTPVLAAVLGVLGMICISAAATPYVRRAGGSTVGVMLVLGSIIGLVETEMVASTFGVDVAGLATYLAAGVTLVAAAWFSPIIRSGRTVHSDRREHHLT